MTLKRGDKIQILDKKSPHYLDVFVVMFKIFYNKYAYGRDVNQNKSDGVISPDKVKIIEL